MPQGNKQSRIIKFALLGLLAGLLLLLCVAVPAGVLRYKKTEADSACQHNLTAARGEAFSEFDSVRVTIDVLADGKPAAGVSVSPDGHRWYTPEDGKLSLDLVPGIYNFKASYKNRLSTVEWPIREDTDNALVIDVVKAPEAPELLLVEAEAGETMVYPLAISEADSVSITKEIDHVSVVRHKGGFALKIQAADLPYCFYHVTLRAENEWGRSESHVGIKLPRDEKVIPIYTVKELAAIRDNLSGNYCLMNDLDMSAVDEWKPIGTVEYPFTGTFDGGGFEITGFHAPDRVEEEKGFALFSYVDHAEIGNVIIRDPDITPQKAAPSSYSSGFLGIAAQSLVENCAVIGGRVAPNQGSASGVLTGGGDGILRNIFNSADVSCAAPNKELKNTGGVVGSFGGYGSYLANEGEVSGSHLTGGIVGFLNDGHLTRCVNSGYIWGSTMVGEYPAGAIVQSADWSALSDSYFLMGKVPGGGRAFTESSVRSLIPVTQEQMKTDSQLPLIGSFTGEAAVWGYASLDADGPVPLGIFREQTEAPNVSRQGNKIVIPAADGVIYFYTCDGSNPRLGQQSESIDITLAEDETLTIFAARSGSLDSETVNYTAEGGTGK